MFSIENNVIYLTKGDDATLSVSLADDDGAEYTLQSGDVLVMTVKAKPGDAEVLFSVTAADGTFTISHADTANLDVGRYSADIQLKTAAGKRHTVWPDLSGESRYSNTAFNNFVIQPEVTTE